MVTAANAREVAPGAALLVAFLEEKGLSQVAAGKALGVSGVTVHDWCCGKKRPKAHHRTLLEVWTGGAVHADSWLLSKERAAMERAREFAAPPESGPSASQSGEHEAVVADTAESKAVG